MSELIFKCQQEEVEHRNLALNGAEQAPGYTSYQTIKAASGWRFGSLRKCKLSIVKRNLPS